MTPPILSYRYQLLEGVFFREVKGAYKLEAVVDINFTLNPNKALLFPKELAPGTISFDYFNAGDRAE